MRIATSLSGTSGVIQTCGPRVGYWGAGQLCATALPDLLTAGPVLRCGAAQSFDGGTSNLPTNIACTQDGDCPGGGLMSCSSHICVPAATLPASCSTAGDCP